MPHRLVVLVAVTAALVLGVVSNAGAAGWSATGPLPAGSAATLSAQVLSPPTGGLLLWEWQNNRPVLVPISPTGVLGTPAPFPTDANNDSSGRPGHAYFLPNGDALFSYEPFNSSRLHLVYRFANGTFGPVLNGTSTLVALAVRAGQALAIEQGGSVITARTISIAGNGALTLNADTQTIYTAPGSDIHGTAFNFVQAAMSADGSADVVAFIDHISVPAGFEVVDIRRARDADGGAWSAATSLSAAVDPGADAGRTSTFSGTNGLPAADPMAVGPDGRAILEFEVSTLSPARDYSTSSSIYALVREPGGTFGPPQLVNATPPAQAGGVYSYVQVAAGGDGTLAIASQMYSCPDQSSSTLSFREIVASVAAPGGGLVSVPVPGGATTAQIRTTPTSIGAGHGRAIIGITTQTNTGSVLPLNGCGSYSTAGQAGTVGDGAVITGGAESTVSTTFATLPWPNGAPPALRVSAGGIDGAGNAAAVGSLATSNGKEYAAYEAPPVVDPGPGDDGGGGGGGGGQPGPAPGATPGPAGPPTPGPAGPTTPVAPKFGAPTPSGDALTFAVTCAATAPCTGTATLTVTQTTTGKKVTAVSAKAKRTRKTVTIGTKTFSVAAGKTVRVTVTLNAAGRKLHKRFAKLPATLTVKGSGVTKKSKVTFPKNKKKNNKNKKNKKTK